MAELQIEEIVAKVRAQAKARDIETVVRATLAVLVDANMVEWVPTEPTTAPVATTGDLVAPACAQAVCGHSRALHGGGGDCRQPECACPGWQVPVRPACLRPGCGHALWRHNAAWLGCAVPGCGCAWWVAGGGA